jgi:hypothetical protein
MTRLEELINTHSPDDTCMQLSVSEPVALNTAIPHMCKHSSPIQRAFRPGLNLMLYDGLCSDVMQECCRQMAFAGCMTNLIHLI